MKNIYPVINDLFFETGHKLRAVDELLIEDDIRSVYFMDFHFITYFPIYITMTNSIQIKCEQICKI